MIVQYGVCCSLLESLDLYCSDPQQGMLGRYNE